MLKKPLIIVLVFSFLPILSVSLAETVQTNSNQTCYDVPKCNQTPVDPHGNGKKIEPLGIIEGVITAIGIGTLTTAVLSYLKIRKEAKTNEEFKIRAQYNEPYIDWCIQIHGAIREFRELCSDVSGIKSSTITFPTSQSRISSSTSIISHMIEMHNAVENGYKWIGVVERQERLEKGEKKIVDSENKELEEERTYFVMNKVFDQVDFIWHNVESEYEPLLTELTTDRDRKKMLFLLSKAKRDEIAKKILTEIKKNGTLMDLKKFDKITTFLLNNIPKEMHR